MSEAFNEAQSDRVTDGSHYNGNCRRSFLRSSHGACAAGDNDVNFQPGQLSGKIGIRFRLPTDPPDLVSNVCTFDIAKLVQIFCDPFFTFFGLGAENAYTVISCRLLRDRKSRQKDNRQQADEEKCSTKAFRTLAFATHGSLPPSSYYLITLSARASTFGGMVRPICLAVLRLMMNSNFIGCSTGRSAGLAPLRILSTYVAARRYRSVMLGP